MPVLKRLRRKLADVGIKLLVSFSLFILAFIILLTTTDIFTLIGPAPHLLKTTFHSSTKQQQKPMTHQKTSILEKTVSTKHYSTTKQQKNPLTQQIYTTKGNPITSTPNTQVFSQDSVNKSKPEEKENMSLSVTSDGMLNKKRFLIFLCDKHRLCGGWGNRQNGILGTYALATVTGRRFGLNLSYPCDIKLLYVPNEINWYVKSNEIRGLSWEIIDWVDKSDCCESDFNKLHPSDVVFLRTNRDLSRTLSTSSRYGHLLPSWYRDGRKTWHINWQKLMKPSIHFEEHIDMFINKIPDKGDLVCAHVRMRRNPTIPNDGRAINSLPSVEYLWEFLSKYETTASRIFIASDSMDVRKSARKRFGSKELDTDGLILHIDRQGRGNNACLGFEMSILEQAVLAKCKVLVMSKSTFSTNAAVMSIIKQQLFMFRNGNVRKGYN